MAKLLCVVSEISGCRYAIVKQARAGDHNSFPNNMCLDFGHPCSLLLLCVHSTYFDKIPLKSPKLDFHCYEFVTTSFQICVCPWTLHRLWWQWAGSWPRRSLTWLWSSCQRLWPASSSTLPPWNSSAWPTCLPGSLTSPSPSLRPQPLTTRRWTAYCLLCKMKRNLLIVKLMQLILGSECQNHNIQYAIAKC